jgi:hypothetical protein
VSFFYQFSFPSLVGLTLALVDKKALTQIYLPLRRTVENPNQHIKQLSSTFDVSSHNNTHSFGIETAKRIFPCERETQTTGLRFWLQNMK